MFDDLPFDIEKIERGRGCHYYNVSLQVDGTENLFLLLDYLDNQNLEFRVNKRKEEKNGI